MHHFEAEAKQNTVPEIAATLAPGGRYVECDFVARTKPSKQQPRGDSLGRGGQTRGF
jgi:hypothetical protein